MDKIKEFLSSKGFSPTQINKITSSYIFNTYKNYDILLSRISNSIKWFEDNKYEEKAIVHMVSDIPAILSLDSKAFEDRIKFLQDNNFNEKEIKKMTKSCAHIFSYSIEDKLQPLIDYLKKLKLSDADIKKILLNDPKLFAVSTDSLDEVFKNLHKLGFNKTQALAILKKAPSSFNSVSTIPNKFKNIKDLEVQTSETESIPLGFDKRQVVKIISDSPKILTYGDNALKKKISTLHELGFEPNAIKQMIIKSSPLLCLSPNTVKKKFEHFATLGYTKKQAVKVLQNMPTLFNLTSKRIGSSFDNMQKYGFDRDTFKEMTVSHASLLNLTNRLMNSKLQALEKLGFTKEDVINITSAAPTLITSSIEMTRDKIEYLRSIGLGSIITKTPTNLITSTATIYARYEYFKNSKPPVQIDDEHYANLFMTWKKFERKYGITKEDLLAQYPYDGYNPKQKTEVSRDGR